MIFALSGRNFVPSAAEASGDTYAVVLRAEIDRSGGPRARRGPEARRVAPYQQQLFLAELTSGKYRGSVGRAHRAGGRLSRPRATERMARRQGIVMDDLIRGIFFKRRWNQVTGISGPRTHFLDEHRVFYAFLLTHP